MPPKVLTRCGKDEKEKLCFDYATSFQQAFKTFGGSTGSSEQKRREGKLQVELSNNRLLISLSCSSLALAIERKKTRDGLVAIPRSNKREKMMKRKKSKTKGRDFSRDGYIEDNEEDSKATLSRTSNIIQQNPDNSLRKVFR